MARCASILTLATANLDNLGDYSITQAKLTALGKKTTAYEKTCPKPRQNVATKSAATKALPGLFEKARKILNTRIDKLMVPFKRALRTFSTSTGPPGKLWINGPPRRKKISLQRSARPWHHIGKQSGVSLAEKFIHKGNAPRGAFPFFVLGARTRVAPQATCPINSRKRRGTIPAR